MAAKSSLNLKTADAVALLAVLFSVAGVYFISLPQARSLSDNTANMKAKQAEAEALQSRYDTLNDLQVAMEQKKSDVDLLLTAYPSEPQLAEAMTQAQSIAERSGMSVESLSPSSAKEDSLPVSLTVKGTYQAFDALSRELRNNLRPILTPQLTINADRDAGADRVIAELSNNFSFNVPSAAEDTSAAPTTE